MTTLTALDLGPILRALPRSWDHPTCLYFVQEDDPAGYIKIGLSENPEARLSNLQVANPRPLRVLGLFRVNPFAETDAHRMFAPLRVRGEWFRPAAEIFAHIAILGRSEELRWS